jgi:hypothetical protein
MCVRLVAVGEAIPICIDQARSKLIGVFSIRLALLTDSVRYENRNKEKNHTA